MRLISIVSLVLIALCFSAPCVHAGESDLDKLIDLMIEKKLITIEEAAALRADLAIKKQAEKEKQKEFTIIGEKLVKLSSYVQTRYQNFEEKGSYDKNTKKFKNNDGFDIRRARVTLKGNITERFCYKLQQEFGGESVKLLDAELSYESDSYLKINIGQFKIPFSQENLISSAKMDLINRSQVVEALAARGKDINGNYNGREIGVMTSGSFWQLNDAYIIDYALGMFNGAGINITDRNEEKDFAGRLVFHPLIFHSLFKSLTIGGSYYDGGHLFSIADIEKKKYNRERIGAEIAYDYKNLSFWGEYITGTDGDYDKLNGKYVASQQDTIYKYKKDKNKFSAANKKEGFYLQAGFFFIPKKLQAVLRFDNYNPNIVKAKDAVSVYTIGANWSFNKWAKIQVNYEYKDEEKGKEVDNNVLLAQFQIGF